MPAAANTYDIVLRPFRELIKLGELATNAAADDPDHENSGPLQAAAKSIFNEGTRALKKLTPMLLNPSPDFGEFLLGLALRHDDVAPRFKDIDVLLYDFEDYIETDSFEKAKFDMVQAAIKGLAIVLLDKIRTHMAEASHDERPTPTVFPPLPPIPKSATPAVLKAPTLRRPVSRHRIAPVDQQIYDSVRRTSQPSDTQPRPTTLERNPSYGDGPLPPRLPVQAGSANIASLPTGMSQLDIRASTLSVNSALPLSPESTQSQFTRYSAASSANLSPSQYRSSVCTSVPETDSSPRDDGDMSPALAKAIDTAANGGYGGYQEYRGTHPDHSNSNPNRPISESAATAREVTTTSNGADGRTTLNDELPTGSNSDTASTKFLLRARSHSRAGSSHANTHRSGDKTDDTSRASIRSGTSSNLRWGSGTAFGPNSSFGLLKGFCKGAQKFIADGPGGAVKKVGGRTQNEGPINKQDYAPDLLFSQMYSTQAGYQDEMAQCSHCEFKEIYSQLLQDMKQDPLANQKSHGMNYRSRLLYKSHVHTRDVHTTYFACLFCSHTGTASREDDATVFQSANLLFRHLSRHQLPLPNVPGVTVLYDSVEQNQPGAQDYDLHFPHPEHSNTLSEPEDDEDVLQPTARAVRDHFNRRGQRPLDRPPVMSANGLDKEEILQFLAGARILHVKFLEKGDGKWCTGWHDGMFGAFPSMMIELEAPSGLSVSNLPKSARSAVTKWKFEPKASSSTPWLRLGRGDKITNIAWDDPRAWYWSGTNSKGKSGIFPKSHIRIETVKDGSQEDSSPLKKKAAPKSGLGSFFSRS